MSKSTIKTEKAPGAIGPYSQGINYGDLVFTSGQIPIDPKNGKVPDGIESQARITLSNLKAVLEAGGSGLDKVLKVTVFLDNMDDFAAINEIYKEAFDTGAEFPARSAVQVARLPLGVLIEVEAIGFKG